MKTIGKKLVIVLILFLAGGTMTSCHQQSSSVTNTMSTSQLLDKIKEDGQDKPLELVLAVIRSSDIREHLYKIISLSHGMKAMYKS